MITYCIALHKLIDVRLITLILLIVVSRLCNGQSSELKLPYWAPGMSHTGEDGYIDTFAVAGNKFRIIHHDTLYDGIVEKYANNKWQTIIEFGNLGNHNDYHIDADVNGDGFKDIILDWRWYSQAYLYNKKTKSFDTDFVDLSGEWSLLDTVRNIYCDNENIKGYEKKSELYTFNGNEKISLGVVEFEKTDGENDGDEKMTKMMLYKYGSIKQGKMLMSKTPLNAEAFGFEFDYIAYWKKRYKKLLGYK
jgi:hypothetical protein